MRPTPSFLLLLCSLLAAPFLRGHEVGPQMAAAARELLTALSAEQRREAVYPLTHDERENWNFVPIARKGVPLKRMNADQHALALALLRTGLSELGMHRAHAVMALELVLRDLENDRSGRRDPSLYFVTIFGEPSTERSWGWRFEGHHLSFNFTIVDGRQVFFAPSFIGSNPAEVRQGVRRGERVLASEEDLGLALINALPPAQRRVAIFSEEPLREIVTTNRKRVDPLSPVGVAFADLAPAHREQLIQLVQLYIGRWRPELAAETFEEIRAAGLDKITFAWAGGLDRSKQTYYRIQGPTFLIEFDNYQGNGNHIHTTFREFKGDFGHDLLREHYAKDHAK